PPELYLLSLHDALPISEPAGSYGGVGYWVMAPFMLEDGGVVWVNRGFVPENRAAAYADGGAGPEGTIEIEGIARRPERANSFTPDRKSTRLNSSHVKIS